MSSNRIMAEEPIEKKITRILLHKKMTVTAAESCTGGLVAGTLVNADGISEVFKESYITYSNEAKHKLLGVKEETLKMYGAVSRQTALEMAEGAAKAANADAAIVTTGIAGPGGGTEEKPVGLVYVGICANCSKFPIKLLLGETNGSKNSRNYIRKLACNAVLYTIWKLT